MMRKTLLSLVLLTVALFSYATNVVPQEDAQLAAKNFMNEIRTRSDFSLADFTLHNVITDAEGTALFYHFQIKDQGFVFVSATDLVDPILAFSLESNYNYETGYSGADFYFKQYEKSIEGVLKNTVAPSATASQQWSYYTSADFVPDAAKLPSSVEPLVTTLWTQEKYYNQYCPYDIAEVFSSEHRTPVGCVALTMLNLMYYYRYPERGVVGAGYYHEVYGIDSVQIANYTYNYATMVDNNLDNYLGELAKLVKHCGTTVSMRYDLGETGGSGAVSEVVGPRMETHWGYHPTVLSGLENFDNNATKWIDTLKYILSERQPLYYAGVNSNNDGGHAWIVDGYYTASSSVFFHVNWGWGGTSNGYYMLPSNIGDYPNGQRAYLSLHPFPESIVKPAQSNIRLTAKRGSVCDGAGNVGYAPNSDRQWVIAVDNAASYRLTPKKIKLMPNDNISVYAYREGALQDRPEAFWGGSFLMPEAGSYFTGNPLPSPLNITADSLLIVFKSTNTAISSIEYNGFNINYSATLSEQQYCRENTMLEVTDEIIISDKDDASHNGKPYLPETKCAWTFTNPNSDQNYRFCFTEFDLADGDVIDIYSKMMTANVNDPAELLYRFDKNNLPDLNSYYVHYGNSLHVRFNVDNWIDGKGFTLKSEAIAPHAGFDANSSISNLSIYPNPVSDQLKVKFSLEEDDNISYQIFDITGKMVMSEYMSQSQGNVSYQIPVHGLAKGFYVLKLTTSKDMIPHKFIVK